MHSILTSKRFIYPAAISALSAITLGCVHDKDQSTAQVTGQEIAMVATGVYRQASEGGPVGAHAIISASDFSKQETILPTNTSDLALSSYGGSFYRIERFQGDNITKFDVNDPAKVVWNYKTLDGGDTITSNPYAMISVSEQKGYLLRYGKRKAWVVNPSAVTQQEFKAGEIDFGHYATDTSTGAPEMAAATLVGTKLFVAMQNLDSGYSPQDSYLAVVDTATDTEINTHPTISGDKAGFKLPVQNPNDITYSSSTHKIYLAGVGKYANYPAAAEYSGGIVTVNPDTYETQLLVDDGDATNHPYGNIIKVAIVNENIGYFVGYHDWKDNAVYEFNPTTGVVASTALITGKGVGCLGVDSTKRLWVCVSPGLNDPTSAKPSVKVYEPKTRALVSSIELSLSPIDIVFATKNP